MGVIEGAGSLRKVDLDDLSTHPPKMVEIALLVEITFLGNQLCQRLPEVRPFAFPERDLKG